MDKITTGAEQEIVLAPKTNFYDDGINVINPLSQNDNSSQYNLDQLELNEWKWGAIYRPTTERWYEFVAPHSGYYTVLTRGSLDTAGYFYNPYCEEIYAGYDNGFDRNFSMVVKLLKGSHYYLMVKSHRGDTGYFEVAITENVFVKHVILDNKELVLNVGDTKKLEHTINPFNATDKSVCFESDNESVATVDQNGNITARRKGYAAIYVRANDSQGAFDRCRVYVGESNIQNITLQHNTYTMKVGEITRIDAFLEPEHPDNKSNVIWTSSDTTVATVDQDGNVKAFKAGETKITVSVKNKSDVSAYCIMTVKSEQVTKDPQKDIDKTYVKQDTVQDPIDVYSGAHTITNTLMTLYGGQSISLVLNYDSSKLLSGVLGTGWYHNFEKRLENLDCEIRVYNNPSSFLTYSCDGDGIRYTCTAPKRNGYVITVDCACEYPYILDCNSTCKEYYNFDGYLVKVADHQGFETLIDYSDALITITDTVSGKKIYLEKDSTGKVVRVYDDASREAFLTYTENLLTTITDLNGKNLTFTYNSDGQVLTGTDSNGDCYFTNTYDDFGRVVTQKDGIPDSIVSTFSYEGNKRITTDRNGHKSIREYDDNGLLISYTNENGEVKTYAYDSHYNIIQETDARGHYTLKSFDNFNRPNAVTNKRGHTTFIDYDAKGNVTKICYPEVDGVEPQETFVYNDRNQLIEHTDLRGTVTVYTYDSASMPLTKKVGNRPEISYCYENGFLKSQTDAKGNTVHYDHNAIGQVTSVTDADNNVTHYDYDDVGNLLKTIDANGKEVENIYDGNNQKRFVKDANGYTTEYKFNANMKNYLIILPDNNKIRYEFDGEDRPVKIIDQSGNETEMQYDKVGRVTLKRFADGATFEYVYDEVGNVIKETNPKGAVTVRNYDEDSNLLTVIDNDGNVTSFEYDKMGKKVKETNAVTGTVSYTYSNAGDLLSETDIFGNTKTYTYDDFGNRLTETDPRGNTTTYTYDNNNNVTSVCDALCNMTNYTYNCLNQLTSVTDAKNNIVSYGYDALGRRTTVTDARGNVFTTVYDDNGNVTATLDANGNIVSETVYNCLNLPEIVVDAAGNTKTYTYNALGKVDTVVDQSDRSQKYSYNSRGQNTSVRDVANNYSRADYDYLGNITRLEGPLGAATNYEYDKTGKLRSQSTSSGGTKAYEYNELNILKKVTNARGQGKHLFYDIMGKLMKYTTPEGAVSYTYDENGNVLTVTDTNGTVTRTYDELNRVKSYTDTYGNVIQYEYDFVGNLTKLIYPDNTAVTYVYDANKNLVSVTDWQGRVTTYTYDANNRVIGVLKPDGSETTTVYDNKQRVVSSVERTAQGVVITGFEYTYDILSRIDEEKHLENNTKLCYTYDDLNRVTKRKIVSLEDNAVISEENFIYDAAGNITDAPDNCFAYDTNNRLIVFDGAPLSYDMDGNMLYDGTAVFTYDSANRLVSAGGNTYTYNAEDVRIRNLCAGFDTTYTYNTNCKLSQLLTKTTNGITTKYVYGNGLIGEEKEGEFKVYHFDYRGSTVAITNATGEITDTFKYDTYGKMTEHIGDSFVIFGYNGRDGVVTDRNGLIYMRARYYSPVMRRFINADIIHGEISDSTSLNRYSFVNGNPVSFVDPFGLAAEKGSDSLYKAWNGIYNAYHLYSSFDKDLSMYQYVRDASKYGFYTKKFGNYVIIKGARTPLALQNGINGTRYAVKNADDYWGVFQHINVNTGLKSEFFLKTPSGKINGGAILNYAGIAIDTLDGVVNNLEEGTRTQKIVSDAIVDVSTGAGIIAGSTAIGSAVGTVVPVAGNIVGAGVGFVSGIVLDWAVNADFIEGKSIVDWTKECGGWAADRVVDAGEAIGDFFSSIFR